MLSTHIVEDIAQACENLAVMNGGTVIFQGTTAQLLATARGKVWTVTTTGRRPEGDFTLVSMLHLGNTVQHRLVGYPGPELRPVPTEPSLEDAYVWLMRGQRVPATPASAGA